MTEPIDRREDAPLLGIFSAGVLRIPHIDVFLREWGRPVRAMIGRDVRDDLAAIVGWGHRETADRARREAARLGLPYLALEDGFVRSQGLGADGVAPLSIIVDDVGIYYDAMRPSRLEALIAAGPAIPPAALRMLDLVRRAGLTKYNLDADDDGSPGSSFAEDAVYVLDQTVDDVSVYSGSGDRATFIAMLDAAQRENPGRQIVVRAHPAVIAGHRKGYLVDYAAQRGIAVDMRGCNWIRLAARSGRVYTVSSQGGFEALLAGAPVTCFGIPFYAGWGLTDDRQRCPRRKARPSLEQVFAAAYWHYPTYVDPDSGAASDGLRVAERLAAPLDAHGGGGLLTRIATAFGV